MNFDQNNGQYRIIVLDNEKLSTSIESVGIWPQAIITNPSGEEYLFEEVKNIIENLRVLAWDPEGVISVKWGLFDIRGKCQLTDWQLLENLPTNSPLWVGDLDFPDSDEFLLRVKIEGASGESIEELVVNLKPNNFFEFMLIIIILCVALASLTSITHKFLEPYIKIFTSARSHFSLKKIGVNNKNFKIIRFFKKLIDELMEKNL